MRLELFQFIDQTMELYEAEKPLLFSAEKKMEIPVGLSLLQEVYHMLPPASTVPASIAVRPAELLPEFLLRFRREFPMCAEMLFPGFFTNDYYHPFTERGESMLSSSIDHTFPAGRSDLGEGASPRPYDTLAAWIGNLLELVRM